MVCCNDELPSRAPLRVDYLEYDEGRIRGDYATEEEDVVAAKETMIQMGFWGWAMPMVTIIPCKY